MTDQQKSAGEPRELSAKERYDEEASWKEFVELMEPYITRQLARHGRAQFIEMLVRR